MESMYLENKIKRSWKKGDVKLRCCVDRHKIQVLQNLARSMYYLLREIIASFK